MPYRSKLVSASFVACLAASAGVQAQEAAQSPTPAQQPQASKADEAAKAKKDNQQETQLQTVVVTGIRESLKKSLDKKRDADAIVEAITAEDIGKLPATNTAEALAQVPGVTLDHSLQATQRVSVDGMDPSLNLSFLDGHPVAQAMWLYGDSPNRGFNYSLLPPEVLGSLEVYKSPEARLPEGSIGGTIIMHTLQPFDLPHNTLKVSVGGNINEMAGEGDPNASSFSNWTSNAMGLGFNSSAQHDEQVTNREGDEIFGYTPVSSVAATADAQLNKNNPPPNPQVQSYVTQQIQAGNLRPNDVMPNEINVAYFQQTEKRDSVLSNIEYKPTHRIDLGVSLLYMQDHLSNWNQSMYAFPLWLASTTAGIDSLSEGGNGVVTSGHVAGNCDPTTVASCTSTAGTVFDNQARTSLITTQGIDLNSTYKGDGWKLHGQLGVSNSHDPLTQAFIEPVHWGSYSWDIGRGFNFDDVASAQNPHNWAGAGWMGNYASEPYSARDNYAQVDFSQDFDGYLFNQFLAGFRYAVHHESQSLDVWSGGVTVGTLSDVGAGSLTDLSGLDSMNFLPGSVNHVQPANRDAVINWVLNSPGVMDSKYLYPPFVYQDTFGVSQASEALYGQANFSADKLRGNVGVRLVRTETASSGYQVNNTQIQTLPAPPGSYVTQNASHFDPLPAFNISYDLTPHTVLRGAISEVIAWAPYNQMAPYTETNDTVLTATGGNANLDPYRSINFGTSAEYYFAPESLFAVSLFHKDVLNYIVQGVDTERLFNGLFTTNPSQYNQLTGGDCDQNGFCNYSVTRPQNGGRATVDGFTVSFQEPFADTGFGIRSNYTFSNGNTKNGGALPYNSKSSVNVSPYFEKGPLSGTLSYNWRTQYLAGGYVAGSPSEYVGDYTELDFSAGFKFTKQISLTADALNLLDETYKAYYGNPSLPAANYKSGREYLVSLHFQM